MESPRRKAPETESNAFNQSYLVLTILLLLTVGATLAFHQKLFLGEQGPVEEWTPVIFLIGLSLSLLIFGMTYREATARAVLLRKTRDLIAAEKQNKALLDAEQTLRIAAEQANRAKDEFLALVSHELKTPLNAIAGWNRILRTRGISDEMRVTAVNKIDKNLRIQTSIVEELLSFSDVMSTSLAPPGKSAVPVSEVLQEAVSAVSDAAFQKGLTLAVDDRLDGERVVGDASRIKVAVSNILANAVKFTPPGGHVEARAFAADGNVKLVVADDGPGIATEFLPHVFDRYSQSEDSSTRHYDGLGLGLTIAEQIVKLHKGTIQAESDGPGSGSKFTITLPSRG